MKQIKKIIPMILSLILFLGIPGAATYAVPKKSGVDSSMSTKLTKKLKCYAYSYKGKKLSYFQGLTDKWARGKISKKTLLKKVYGLQWNEKAYFPDSEGGHPIMTYMVGKWNVRCVSYTTKVTTVSGIVNQGIRSPGIGNGYSVEVTKAVWNKKTRTYKIYFFATTLLD